MLAGLGICTGVLSWAFSASLGLSALLAISSLAYNTLRIAGACYLTYLGARILMRARHSSSSKWDSGPARHSDANGSRWFRRGFFTNILNPKVGVFYISFLPQFIPAGVHVLAFSMLLSLIHATEGIVWFFLLAKATDSLSRWLLQAGVARTIDAAMGAVFIAFGIRLALDDGR